MDKISQLFGLSIGMKKHPLDGHICVSQDVQQMGYILKYILFLNVTIDNILLKLVETTFEMPCMSFSQGTNIAIIDVVLTSFLCSREDFPELGDIHQVALIDLDNKVVREMFISNFSHFGVLILKNPWAKVEHHENDRSLLGECYRSVLRVGVS